MNDIDHYSREFSKSEWVTARVVPAYQAKRLINQLEMLGVDFVVQEDGRELRILVPVDRGDEVLDWLKEPVIKATGRATDGVTTKDAIVLLVALSVGLLGGSVFAKLVGIDPTQATAVSSLGGIVAVVVASLINARKKDSTERAL